MFPVLLTLVTQTQRSLTCYQQYQPPIPLWLTLDQAVQYSGLSRALLMRAVANKRIAATNDGGWKLRRESIDQFDPTQEVRQTVRRLKVVTQEIRGRRRK